ncbi:MAG: acyltransferase [Barnesiella sp.]|nr:acyltransferase [Barnesiella sp.]
MTPDIDFSEISPYSDGEFREKMAQLVLEPGFEHAVRYIMPDVDYPAFAETLKQVPDQQHFQTEIMWPFLEMLAKKTTSDITVGGLDIAEGAMPCTFITNHRDIVLDASFLNLCFLRRHLPTSEIAIGNNLLIYDWITDLVKLNKSFIVKRNLRITKALEAARQLSAYIRYAINTKKESVWIAQREGRAKDSNDLTQEAVIKMLALSGGEDNLAANLIPLKITPVAISYEYDPNDYLKAREYLLKKIDPEFKKSQRDDLFSMETGLLQPKGKVHFEIAPCINPQLESLLHLTDKVEVVREVCDIINKAIHLRYRIYPINYIAYDMLNHTEEYADKYTPDEVAAFDAYITNQLAKVELPEMAVQDHKANYEYMHSMMLTMYSNPLKNQLAARQDSMAEV